MMKTATVREMRISVIRKIAREQDQENWEFRSMLKASGIPHSVIDESAHAIYETLKGDIECTQCGYCCKRITPVLSEADVKRIARHFKMSIKSVHGKWLTQHEQIGTIFIAKPCPFLEKRKCSIYSARPHDCRSYPHLYKKKILNYFTSIFSHIDLCPIMFHFYEEMKKKFRKKLDSKKVTWL